MANLGTVSIKCGKAGVVAPPKEVDDNERLVYSIVDDLLFNTIQDLLIKVHRDEKIARANTAAIKVEKMALAASDSATPDAKPDVRIETEAAVYEDGRVTLKGNPLKTTREILCPRCHLPRLLHPTDGKGARKPDPNTVYCKKTPYIEKPGFDIYGQMWVAQGPGRGKKKKELEKKQLEANGDSPSPMPGAEGAVASGKDRPPNVLSFPSATCSKCKRCILVTRLNNHMGSCIGNSGRNASRAAAQKISNSNGGSHDSTPPGSQRGTPGLPSGSRGASPRKREASVMDDDGGPPSAAAAATGAGAQSEAAPHLDDQHLSDHPSSTSAGPVKKKLKVVNGSSSPAPSNGGGAKPTPVAKKVILKNAKLGSGLKKDKIRAGNSLLSVEQKADDTPGSGGSKSQQQQPPTKSALVEVAPKKSLSKLASSPAKKLKLNATAKLPPSIVKANIAADRERGDGGSESSGNLSSPPH